MVSLEVGRVCLKTAGDESGKVCVVVKKMNGNFVLVTGPKLLTGVKRRRSNTGHLRPTQDILEIKEDINDEEIIEAYKKSGLITKLGLKLPSAAELKAEKAKPVKETKKEEKKSDKKGKEEKVKEEKKK